LHILQNIGCLVEQPFFYADLSAYENLNYLDMLYRCGQKRIKEVKIEGKKKDDKTSSEVTND